MKLTSWKEAPTYYDCKLLYTEYRWCRFEIAYSEEEDAWSWAYVPLYRIEEERLKSERYANEWAQFKTEEERKDYVERRVWTIAEHNFGYSSKEEVLKEAENFAKYSMDD